jgi:hypothetical protein
MSDRISGNHLWSVPYYVDHVLRKEKFLAQHPEAVVEVDKDAPPRRRWHGRLPGHEEIVAEELRELLDRLERIVGGENELHGSSERLPGESSYHRQINP